MKRILSKIRAKPQSSKHGEINYHWFDRFTFVHFLIGCIYGYLNLDFWVMLPLAIGWELVENALKVNLPFIFPNGTADTLQNAFGDCLAVCLGWIFILITWSNVF